eukprot:scaffold9052_cov107-Isochrysis_galbana.AAC.6
MVDGEEDFNLPSCLDPRTSSGGDGGRDIQNRRHIGVDTTRNDGAARLQPGSSLTLFVDSNSAWFRRTRAAGAGGPGSVCAIPGAVRAVPSFPAHTGPGSASAVSCACRLPLGDPLLDEVAEG